MVGKKRFILPVMLVLSLGFLAWAQNDQPAQKHPDVDFSISCVECHSEVTPDIVKQWRGSKHGMMNFACYMCHGDGKETFYARPKSDRCISCHPAYEVDFSSLPVKSCFGCHGGHTLKFHQE